MRLTQVTAVVLLIAFLPACTSYQALADPVAGLRKPATPIDRARITLVTGECFELTKLAVSGDSLSGIRKGAGPVNLALSDVAKAEVRKPDLSQNVGLLLTVVAIVGVVYVALTAVSRSLVIL